MANEEKQMSKEEQIGFHKGSLSTLAKEREEFTKVLGVVEQLIQMHLGALKELGVDMSVAQEAAGQPTSSSAPATKKKPIEDIL